MVADRLVEVFRARPNTPIYGPRRNVLPSLDFVAATATYLVRPKLCIALLTWASGQGEGRKISEIWCRERLEARHVREPAPRGVPSYGRRPQPRGRPVTVDG